ncbi:DUF3710 domain-containing protein [Frankia sp. B2]|uniref:DUF3710 domain-containing protein n=1 Tax=Frankia sp. B2 TaxID=2541730 RepID=UPI00106A9390|nr:DUF3710 domain-containing protein [Frankia sp. B2]TFE24503.1 DUF3710 domain-containing protein [Frankia sp. B2]
MFGRGRREFDRRGASEMDVPEKVTSRGSSEPDGPYDIAQAPDDDVYRLDLGSLRIPALDGMQVQFQVEESTGKPLTVLVTDGRSAMELSVFAAPKSRGLWDEVRAEILETIQGGGGSEADGRYGPELRMSLPTGRPGETVPGRMIGVDGPRWFLRAVVTGAAGQDPAAGPLLDAALRNLIISRGDGAMPVRDPLPLRLPKEATDHPDHPDGSGGPVASATSGRPEMPVRGARIAEIR